jgi:hypothetical protein
MLLFLSATFLGPEIIRFCITKLLRGYTLRFATVGFFVKWPFVMFYDCRLRIKYFSLLHITTSRFKIADFGTLLLTGWPRH